MASYSAAITQKLFEELHDCLLDAGVLEVVAKFLVDKKITKSAAFPDFAKAGIIEVVGRPAVPTPEDRVERCRSTY